jgi:hypothetical protein
VWLFLHGEAQPGDTVYVEDVDCFSVKPSPGAAEMGVVLALEPDRQGWCVVMFKAFDDPRPLLPESFRYISRFN